jgi:hypothetical protein
MKNVLLLFLAVSCLSSFAQRRSRNLNDAPEVVDPPRTGHAVGVVLSSHGGSGLAYRYWPKRVGIQVSFLPFSNDEINYYNVGSMGYLTLKEFNRNNKFYLQVCSRYALSDQGYDYNYGQGYVRRAEERFGLAFGPGIETHSRYGSFSAFLGYGWNYTNQISGVSIGRVNMAGGLTYFFEI